MRKQGFLMTSTQLPTVLECSSIRINEEDLEEMEERDKKKVRNINFKQFQENSLNGLEATLSMNGSKENILELLRSKSAESMLPKAKDRQEQHNQTGYAASLYNTNSFDDMTMKMTINRTQLGSPTQFNQNFDFKLKKPEEMKKFKASYADSDMKIVLSKQNNVVPKNENRLQDGFQETKEEKEARERRVADFYKRQALLDNLKCSNVDSEPSRNFDDTSSFQEPYFKTPVEASLRESERVEKSNRMLGYKQQVPTPCFSKIVKNKEKSPIINSKSTKKLTLRDYMHLNELSGKAKESECDLSPAPLSPNNKNGVPCGSPRSSVQTSRKRKTVTSNGEVVSRLKKDITRDILLLKSNLDHLLKYFEEDDRDTNEPSPEEIMRIYGVSRMFKERMLAGNDEIIKILGSEGEAKGQMNRN